MAKVGGWQDATREILDALDLRAEYESLGVIVTGSQPNHAGWLECRAFGRDDNNPSAGINVGRDVAARGRYKDFGGTGESVSLFDFAVLAGRFPDWAAARKHYAQIAGIKLPGGQPPRHPAESLEFLPWNDQLVQLWCLRKPGVTPAAVRAAGCRLAKWPKKSARPHFVIAMPTYGSDLLDGDPVGWVLWNQSGQKLPLFQGKGKPPKQVKMLTTGGSKAGWLGQAGLASIVEAKTVWLVEGPTDMLALHAILPEDSAGAAVVLANSGGSTENPRPELLACLAGKNVAVVRDADEAGDLGALKWCSGLVGIASNVKLVKLPLGETQKKHGRDLRDWINEGGTYGQLVLLASETPVFTREDAAAGAKKLSKHHAAPWESDLNKGLNKDQENGPATDRDGSPSSDGSQNDDSLLIHERQILRAIRLDILGELADSGHIRVFSEYHRKTTTIADISRLTYPALLKICGPPAKEHVVESTGDSPPPPGVFPLREVKESIALMAGFKRITDQTIAGPGCWLGNESGDPQQESILLAGSGEIAIWNGSGKLERVSAPRVAGRIFDISNTDPWYRFDELRSHVEDCDQKKTTATIKETIEIFSRWRWEHPDSSPAVVTGLILASWVQSLWDWRPQVAVTGQSNAGKTTLFSCLCGIFGKLALKTSDASAAGIRQHIQSSAHIVLGDEFEANSHRQQILEMMRASGRGDNVWRGTPSQKGYSYQLRHIFWVASVELGLSREADRNRFIRLELKRAAKENRNQLQVPSAGELHRLGMRLLGIAIKHSRDALKISHELKSTQIEGVHERVIESYSVPCSILAAAFGLDVERRKKLLADMVAPLATESKPESDEEDLINTLLSSLVDIGRGERRTVASLVDGFNRYENSEHLEQCGISVVYGRDENSRYRHEIERPREPYLFVTNRTATDRLLKNTKWSTQAIEQILRRIAGAFPDRRKISSQKSWGTSIPLEWIKQEFLEDQSEDPKDPERTQDMFA